MELDQDPPSLSPEFARFLESVPAAAYLCDPSGLITFYNQRAVEVWGRKPLLQDPADRFCGSFKLSRPDGTPVAHEECWMALALRNGRDYDAEEIVIERPDGTRATVLAHAHPIRDAAGRIAGAVNVLVDVTGRRQALEASLRLGAIVEHSDDAIVSKSLDGTIRSWNPAAERMFGYLSDEVIGKSITVIIPEERLPEETEVLSRVRRGEGVNHFETVRRRKDGTLIDISLTVSPVKSRDGTVIGVSKIARDITERKRVERLLREADRQKDEFLAILAHELRNPLAPISNAAHLLKLEGVSAETAERARSVIERQVKQMVRLVDDLMDVSRITRNKLTVRKQPVELSTVLQNAAESVRPWMIAADHRLEMSLPAEPLYVEADLTRLVRVFMNLLSNSVKYSDRGGHTWLEAGREGDQVVVRVRDDGIGIPAEMQDRIFEMFTQVDRSLERAHGGLGIGLSLARRLIAMHGGTIEARSEGIGHGSEFIVRLPALVGRAPDEAHPSDRAEESRSTPRRRVLVVDDNVDAARTLSSMLRLQGDEVRTAHDGLRGFEEAEAFRPQLALLDIGLPKLNGYEVARRIRGEPWGREVLLVAVTGWGQAEDRRRSADAGFDLHLVKPIDLSAMEELLGRFAGRRQVGSATT